MSNVIRILFIFILICPIYIYACPQAVKFYIPNAQLVGMGRLKFWIWDVYDISLYAPGGHYNESKPFALSIRYLISVSSNDLVARTIKEILQQGYKDKKILRKWQKELKKIFPNVQEGHMITAVMLDDGSMGFFSGNQALGYITSPVFTKKFFDIWLGQNTSEPLLRMKLLNLDP